VIKYDKHQVQNIESNYDSTYKESTHNEDFWTIDHYFKDSIEYKIMRDSADNIVGIVKSINGIVYSGKEYYSNGQLIAKTNFPPGKIDGEAIYYYEDGRIRSNGVWKENKMVGDWYYYDTLGRFMYIDHYDNYGNLINKEK
jgi:antitoxin component YwqK of YwqJK toxin-antitoxin module